MAEQLAILPPPDPWQDVRAIAPGAILVRVIALEPNLQYWLRLERTPANLERGAELYEGATILTYSSRPGGLPSDEREAIIATADAAWSPPAAEG